jgi:hypothetical protein
MRDGYLRFTVLYLQPQVLTSLRFLTLDIEVTTVSSPRDIYYGCTYSPQADS